MLPLLDVRKSKALEKGLPFIVNEVPRQSIIIDGMLGPHKSGYSSSCKQGMSSKRKELAQATNAQQQAKVRL